MSQMKKQDPLEARKLNLQTSAAEFPPSDSEQLPEERPPQVEPLQETAPDVGESLQDQLLRAIERQQEQEQDVKRQERTEKYGPQEDIRDVLHQLDQLHKEEARQFFTYKDVTDKETGKMVSVPTGDPKSYETQQGVQKAIELLQESPLSDLLKERALSILERTDRPDKIRAVMQMLANTDLIVEDPSLAVVKTKEDVRPEPESKPQREERKRLEREQRAMEVLFNERGATTPEQQAEVKEWLRTTPEGQKKLQELQHYTDPKKSTPRGPTQKEEAEDKSREILKELQQKDQQKTIDQPIEERRDPQLVQQQKLRELRDRGAIDESEFQRRLKNLWLESATRLNLRKIAEEVLLSDAEGQQIADSLGIRYDGIQEGGSRPDTYTMTDLQTGTTINSPNLEMAQQKLEEKRQLFGQASRLNLKKKAAYTYSIQLLSEMIGDLDTVSANATLDGAEAVVSFQGEGMEPLQYHVRVTDMGSVKRQQEAVGERGEYSWGPEGPPAGITNALQKLRTQKIAADPTYEQLQKGVEAGHITSQEMTEMMQYYNISPTPSHWEMAMPDFGGESEWDPNRGKVPAPEESGRMFYGSLNLRTKKGDTEGPGSQGEWWPDYESGPQLNRDKYRKDKRHPFYNAPGQTPGDGEQGNIFNSQPGAQNMDTLEARRVFPRRLKTADNDMFETYLWENIDGAWVSQTIFKQHYAKFKPGDLIVQYGGTPKDINTFRRRYGSIGKAKLNILTNLAVVAAVVIPTTTKPSAKPTPDDSLHEIQTGKPNMAPDIKEPRWDKKDAPGPRDAFEVSHKPEQTRKHMKRPFIPHMDVPDSEGSGLVFTPTVRGLNLKRQKDANISDITSDIVNQWLEVADTIGAEDVLNFFSDRTAAFQDTVAALSSSLGQQRAEDVARVVIEEVPARLKTTAGKKDDKDEAMKMEMGTSKKYPDKKDESKKAKFVTREQLKEYVKDVKDEDSKKANFAAPVPETPEERAGTPEQPPVKDINRDPKRPLTPKKRFDYNETQTRGTGNEYGDKPKIHMQ